MMIKILIVDDKTENLYFLKSMLDSNDFKTISAKNGAEALGLMRTDIPDLIITDVLMPVMDGFTFCRECKKDEKLKTIPFFFYTGTYTDAKDEEYAMSLGADRFILKPQEPDDFLKILNDFLGEVKKRAIHSKKIVPQPDEVILKEYNEVLIRKIEDKMFQSEKTEKKLRKYAEELEKEILEHKKSEESLLKSEAFNRLLFNSSTIGLALCRMDGSLVDVNPAYAKIIGRTIEETLKLSYWDITPEKYAAREEEQLKCLIKTGYYGKYEKEYIHKDGHLVPVILQGISLVRDGESFIWSSIEDITSTKQAEEALAKEQYLIYSLMNTLPDHIYFKDLSSRFIRINKAQAQYFGLSDPVQAVGKTDSDFFSGEHANQAYEDEQTIIRTGKSINVEEKETHINRPDIWVSTVKLPLKDKDGNIIGTFGISRDITKRKTTEEALLKSQHLFQTLAQVSPVGIFRTNADGNTTYVNPKWSELSGFSSREAFGEGWLNAVHPEDRGKLSESWANNLKSGNESSAEYRFLRPDGSTIWVIGKAVPELIGNEVTGYIGTITDITELKRAEEILRESEKKYRRIFENVQDLYYETTIEGTILEISPSIEILSKGQYHPVDLIGKSMNEFYPDPLERANLISKLNERGSVTDFEITLRNRDGSSVPCSISSKIYCDAQGRPEKILGSTHDITERKKFEEELITAKVKAEESDNLKTAFLHNISHEIRTPLNAIVGFSALLTEPGLDDESKFSFIETITQSSNQLLAIISDIIEISNIDAGILKYSKSEIKINLILQRLFDQFLPEAKEKSIEFKKETPLSDDRAVILSDNTKFIQIITNLLSNAFKFTQSGNIEFGYTVADKFLNFYVSDTGIGIPEDQYLRIFDRFYQVEHRMARHFEGTGLGLSISKAFVELLGGRIWVDSELGKGSVFYFSLPYNRSEAKMPDNKQTVQEFSFNRKTTILIAEDDDNNFSLISKFLAIPNLTLIRAKNGLEAVQYCESSKDIALVLMDLKMPEMDGYEATVKIKKLFPELTVIAQTAFVTDKEKARDCGCSEIITKPFKRKDVIEVLSKYLKS
jgi:PAS domain S-box-containing protein